jgi:peptide/nickel transport system substrate-binding protein
VRARTKSVLLALGLVVALAGPGASATLKVAAVTWPPGYGNPYVAIAQATSHTRNVVYDPLVRVDHTGKLIPALAIGWEPLPPNIWRFRLRPSVVFSNGEPFDAAAVKAVVDWLKSPASVGQLMSAEVANVVEVRVVDALTVDFVTATVDAVLPKRLTVVMMTPPKAWAERGVDGFTQVPIGTGSYVLKDWGQSSGRTILEANPTSWRKPKAIDRVEIYPLREPIRRVQALTSGQVDLTQAIGPEDITAVKDQGFTVFVEPEATVMGMFLRNVGNEGQPINDVRVRQALNYAVNKDEIADTILRGTSTPVGQGAIPGTFGYDPALKPYPHDPARAKALLTEAGFPNGFKIAARLQPAGPLDAIAIYQKVASDLAAVGVELELRQVMPNDWVRMYATGDWDGADAVTGNWNSAAFGDTIRALEMYACRRPGTFFCDREADRLIDASNGELDDGKREALLRAAMARFHDQAPSLFLVNYSTIVAHHARVKNVTLGRGGFIFEAMELADPP